MLQTELSFPFGFCSCQYLAVVGSKMKYYSDLGNQGAWQQLAGPLKLDATCCHKERIVLDGSPVQSIIKG